MIRCLFCGHGFIDYSDMSRWEGRPAHRQCIEDFEMDRYEAHLAGGGR